MVKIELKEFYKVEYLYQNKTQYACYFNLTSAQEAMMKMIQRNVIVNGLSTHVMKNLKIVLIQKNN